MRLPSLRRRTGADAPPAKAEPASGTATQGGASSAASAGTASGRAAPATAPPRQSSDPHERIDGLRAWLAQVDRKLGVRTYAIGAAVVLALAAGIVGVVLALSAKDESATKDEVRSLEDQLSAVTEQASSAAREEAAALSDRVQALEEQVSSLNGDQTTLERELDVVKDDINDLRSQASNPGNFGGGSGSGRGPLGQSGNP